MQLDIAPKVYLPDKMPSRRNDDPPAAPRGSLVNLVLDVKRTTLGE